MSLEARIEALEQRLGVLEDKEAIGRLQRTYGYYIDNRMWAEMADLFAEQGSIEIGRRGRYDGRARVKAFLEKLMGGGRWGLTRHEVINHMQHQLVISVDADRHHAQARARAVVMASPPRDETSGGAALWPQDQWMLAEGVYENRYVLEDGVWKIEHLGWVPTFYVRIPGWDTASFDSAPPSGELAPDALSATANEALGRGFLPFHYPHPVTGRPMRTP